MSVHVGRSHDRALPVSVLLPVFVGVLACAACAAPSDPEESTESTETTDSTSAALMSRGSLGADGDSCSVRTKPDGTKVPGTEKDGECCSNADPSDCVIILKPFPGAFSLLMQ